MPPSNDTGVFSNKAFEADECDIAGIKANPKKPIWDLAHGILNEGMLLLVENPSQSFSGF